MTRRRDVRARPSIHSSTSLLARFLLQFQPFSANLHAVIPCDSADRNRSQTERKSMKPILLRTIAVASALMLARSSASAWDFVFGYQNVFDGNSDLYIVGQPTV